MGKKDFNEGEAAGMASKMGANATEKDVENVRNKMGSMNKGPLAKVWDKVTKLWDVFTSPDTPKSLKVMIIGGLIYMVSPVDLIPDFIPFAGLLDDVAVIGLTFSRVFALGAIALGAIALTVHLLNKKEVQKELVRRNMEKGIVENIEKGNVNTVKIGLYDSSNTKTETLEYNADEVKDLEVGMEIYA